MKICIPRVVRKPVAEPIRVLASLISKVRVQRDSRHGFSTYKAFERESCKHVQAEATEFD